MIACSYTIIQVKERNTVPSTAPIIVVGALEGRGRFNFEDK